MKNRTKQDTREVVFETKNLRKIYSMGEVEVPALDRIDISLRKGELLVLLGPSGSGKSTLLNLLGGLDTPTTGTVRFKDHDLFSSDGNALTQYRRDHVGFVFQFYNLIPSLTAKENVALVTDISENPMTPEEALKEVGLLDRKDHFPVQLSGGEQQRIAIARAIAKRPEVLLCDEPTGALDIKTGRMVLEAIFSINKKLGTTTIIITHNSAIARMADRVITMRDGLITSDKINTEKVELSEITW